jgi:hypothetical protein
VSGSRRLRKALVMCVDQTFAPFAIFLASQINRLCPARDFDICLVSDAQLVVPPAFDGLHLRLIGPVQDPAYLALENRELPRSTYLRLWIPHLLNQDYDRLIYLDADMFAEGGDWSALFEVDLQGHALAAVRDVQQWREPERKVFEFEATRRGSRPYFNSGLMVIDPAIFVARDVRDRCLALGPCSGRGLGRALAGLELAVAAEAPDVYRLGGAKSDPFHWSPQTVERQARAVPAALPARVFQFHEPAFRRVSGNDRSRSLTAAVRTANAAHGGTVSCPTCRTAALPGPISRSAGDGPF